MVDISKIPTGIKPPWDINVIVEVSLGGEPVKYEFDKESGAIYVDRILHTSMRYPCNYGFLPHTLADDGDAVDVLVVTNEPIIPKAVMRCRPVGVLLMEDEEGLDEKILAVPSDKLIPFHASVSSYRDLPQILLDQIAHFFEHYKDLEPNKWAKVQGWGEPAQACKLIEDAMEAYNKKNK